MRQPFFNPVAVLQEIIVHIGNIFGEHVPIRIIADVPYARIPAKNVRTIAKRGKGGGGKGVEGTQTRSVHVRDHFFDGPRGDRAHGEYINVLFRQGMQDGL